MRHHTATLTSSIVVGAAGALPLLAAGHFFEVPPPAVAFGAGAILLAIASVRDRVPPAPDGSTRAREVWGVVIGWAIVAAAYLTGASHHA